MAKGTRGRIAPRRGRAARTGSRIGRIARRTLLVVFFFALGAVGGALATFYWFSLDLPAIGPLLEGYDPPQTTRILAADGTVIGELFVERRTVVPIDGIPRVMVDAVIAAEDADFRAHEGLDYPGMLRAMYANVTEGRLAQGASTITQQVARTFFLTPEKTFARKIREILLTKRIEERLTKDEILHLYLNQINFGHARYGVQEAARFYFDKDVGEIGLAEAALLAGIPKGPAVYEPIGHPEAALERRAYVLGEMAEHGFVTGSEAALAASSTLGLALGAGVDDRLAPEAVSCVIEEISDAVDLETLRHGGYVVETGLVPDLQRAARAAIRSGLGEIDARHGRLGPFEPRKRWPEGNRAIGGDPVLGRTYVAEVVGCDRGRDRLEMRLGGRTGYVRAEEAARYNPEGLPLDRLAPVGCKLRVSLSGPAREGLPLDLRLEIGPQAALAAVEPGTGRIVALAGGDSVGPRGFDRATQASRQPGSAFKPFVYLEAIRTRRYTAATILDDAPEVEGDWKPQSSSPDGYAGAVRLREAVARSLNLPAVKVIRDVGPDRVAELAERLGIRSELEETPSLALGSSAVNPLEMASAYGAFAAGGVRRAPWMIRRAVGPDGLEIPLVGRTGERVVAPEEAYVLTSLLKTVITSGTGRRAARLGRPAAGKTGTSNRARDAWFVGYTPDLSCAVWVGYDDYRPIGRKESGGRAALPIWLEFMKVAHEGRDERGFDRPEGISTAAIDPETGLLAYEGMEEAVEEVFIEGTEPVETALPPDLVSLGEFALEQAAGTADAGAGERSAADAGEQ